jgi:curved DNA-binding protein
MAAFKDYYQVLGIARDASDKDVRRAFRRLAAKHHPDRNRDDPGAEERFKEINEAYTVLSDPEKRSVYDRFGSAGPTAGGFSGGGFPGGFPGGYTSQGGTFYTNVRPEDAAGFSDFFRSLFGAGMGEGAFVGGGSAGGVDAADPFGSATRRPGARPRTVEATLQVELERAFHGGPVSVRVDGRALEVTLPAGVRDGAKLRLRGQAPGGGDLVLIVRHQPHPRWRLEGDHLRVVTDVPDHVAVLGGPVRVSTLDGDVDLSVPANTATGRRLRLRGRGWPVAGGTGGARGDAMVEVRVVVPRSPTDAQREAYERLRALAVADGD